jgi:myo-inositol-1(or 4)-monophosphatase
LIVTGLRRARPDDAIVGEEGAAQPGTSGLAWHIDPIDGTTNFLYGLPGYAVSVGVADGERTLAGAVFVPSTGELFAASAGDGATLNGRTIRCSTASALPGALVATGFAYLRERREAQIERAGQVLRMCRDLRRGGAASVDLCHAACGRVDVYYEEHLSSWDMMAGELIAREAGCRSGAVGGGPVANGSVLVCPPALFDDMVALLALGQPNADRPGHHG